MMLLVGCLSGCLSLTQVDAQRSALESARLLLTPTSLLFCPLHSLRCTLAGSIKRLMLHGCLSGCLSFVQETLLQVTDAQRSAMVSARLQTPAGQQRGLLFCTLHSLRCWR